MVIQHLDHSTTNPYLTLQEYCPADARPRNRINKLPDLPGIEPGTSRMQGEPPDHYSTGPMTGSNLTQSSRGPSGPRGLFFIVASDFKCVPIKGFKEHCGSEASCSHRKQLRQVPDEASEMHCLNKKRAVNHCRSQHTPEALLQYIHNES